MPGDKCVIKGCQYVRKKGSAISMHKIPWKDTVRHKLWIDFIKKAGTPEENIRKTSRICRAHFEGGEVNDKSVPVLFVPGKMILDVIYTPTCHKLFIRRKDVGENLQ